MDSSPELRLHPRWHLWLALALAVISLGSLVMATLPDPMDTAGVVCSAVCHRLQAHTLTIGGEYLPLCARCTGTFLGSMIGVFGQLVLLRRRRESTFPAFKYLFVLGLFSALWAGDGLNSFIDLRFGVHLYAPQNWLRLVTGSLHGLTVSALLLPLFNFSVWKNPSPERTIQRWRELGLLVLLEAGLVGLVLVDWPVLLYPLGLLSAAGVLLTLTTINSVLVMMIARWENRYLRYREAAAPLLLGFVLSLVQVGVMDLVRYLATGSLEGIPGF